MMQFSDFFYKRTPLVVIAVVAALGISIASTPFHFLSFESAPQEAYAADLPFGIPFGGMMLAIVPCLCSGGIAGVVGPPAPGVFVLQPGVGFLYQYFQWRPGSWQVGLAAPGGVCSIPAPHSGCMTFPVEGTVIIDGTSL